CSSTRPLPVSYPRSVPTRRSSDLYLGLLVSQIRGANALRSIHRGQLSLCLKCLHCLSRSTYQKKCPSQYLRRCHYLYRHHRYCRDRKSTRLNSSHVSISYASCCLS